MKDENIESSVKQVSDIEKLLEVTSRPGRKSNPLPTSPDEDEEIEPGKQSPKRKKKNNEYEVTC